MLVFKRLKSLNLIILKLNIIENYKFYNIVVIWNEPRNGISNDFILFSFYFWLISLTNGKRKIAKI